MSNDATDDTSGGEGRTPNTGLPPDAPEVATRAVGGADLTGREDFDLFGWLLGAREASLFDVTSSLITPAGRRRLVFRVRTLDGDDFAQIEREHRIDPLDPMSELRPSVNAALVAEATLMLRDPANDRTIDVRSAEFRGDEPDPAARLAEVLKDAPGVLEAVASELRAIAGYRGDAVLGTTAVEAAAGNGSEPAAASRSGSTPTGGTGD